VDAVKLRQRLALTAADYNTTQSSMAALCSDLVRTSSPASKRPRDGAGPAGAEQREVGLPLSGGVLAVCLSRSGKRR